MDTAQQVRVLPPDTPGIPASVPYVEPLGYQDHPHCGEAVWREEMTPEQWAATRPGSTTTGYFCTLPPHGDTTPHACHIRWDHGPVHMIVVWGGE